MGNGVAAWSAANNDGDPYGEGTNVGGDASASLTILVGHSVGYNVYSVMHESFLYPENNPLIDWSGPQAIRLIGGDTGPILGVAGGVSLPLGEVLGIDGPLDASQFEISFYTEAGGLIWDDLNDWYAVLGTAKKNRKKKKKKKKKKNIGKKKKKKKKKKKS